MGNCPWSDAGLRTVDQRKIKAGVLTKNLFVVNEVLAEEVVNL